MLEKAARFKNGLSGVLVWAEDFRDHSHGLLARMMLPPHIQAQGKAHRVRDLARNIISYSCQEIGKLQLYAGLKSPKVSVINTNKRGYNFHRTQVRLLHCIVTPSLRPPLLVVRLEGCAPGV